MQTSSKTILSKANRMFLNGRYRSYSSYPWYIGGEVFDEPAGRIVQIHSIPCLD